MKIQVTPSTASFVELLRSREIQVNVRAEPNRDGVLLTVTLTGSDRLPGSQKKKLLTWDQIEKHDCENKDRLLELELDYLTREAYPKFREPRQQLPNYTV